MSGNLINPPDIILLWTPVGAVQNNAIVPGIVDQSTGYPILEPYSNLGTHYTGEIGVLVQCDTGIVLTGATSTSINVFLPNGSSATWIATVVSAPNGISSVLQYTTQTGDLYYPGTYSVQPSVVFSNWSGFGEIGTFTIYENIV